MERSRGREHPAAANGQAQPVDAAGGRRDQDAIHVGLVGAAHSQVAPLVERGVWSRRGAQESVILKHWLPAQPRGYVGRFHRVRVERVLELHSYAQLCSGRHAVLRDGGQEQARLEGSSRRGIDDELSSREVAHVSMVFEGCALRTTAGRDRRAGQRTHGIEHAFRFPAALRVEPERAGLARDQQLQAFAAHDDWHRHFGDHHRETTFDVHGAIRGR